MGGGRGGSLNDNYQDQTNLSFVLLFQAWRSSNWSHTDMWRCTKPKTSLNGRESQVILDIVHCVTLIWNGEMYFPVITISVRLVLMLMYEWVSICTRVLNVHGWLISPCLCSVKSALSPSFFFFSFFFPFFFGWTLFRFSFLMIGRMSLMNVRRRKEAWKSMRWNLFGALFCILVAVCIWEEVLYVDLY